MTGTAINPILFGLSLLAAVVGIVAPLGALGVMFWHWHIELNEMLRLRQARSTQVK